MALLTVDAIAVGHGAAPHYHLTTSGYLTEAMLAAAHEALVGDG